MKKTKKASKPAVTETQTPKTETQPTPTTEVEITESKEKEGYDPMTDDAFKWATSSKSIPGAYAPILYFGPNLAIRLSEILGRPLNLEEVKLLARADGEVQKCTVTEREFQPIAYVPYVPRDLEDNLKDGKTLSEVFLPSGGQFYLIKGRPTPVSGSVYHFDPRSGEYPHAHASPLVSFANEIQRMTGKRIWGLSSDRIRDLLEKKDERRAAKNAMFEKARSLAEQFVSSSGGNRGGVNRMSDAFDKRSNRCKERPSRHHVDDDGEK